MFAVIKTGGLQYRVAAEDVLTIGRVSGEPGDIVEFNDVLLLGGDTVTLGTPTVPGALVAAELVEQTRGEKVIAFKKRRRKNSRRKRGHRQELSVIRVTEILTGGARPTVKARPKAEPAPAPQAAEAAPEAQAATPEAGAAPKAKAKAVKKPAKPKAEISTGKAKAKKAAPAKKK